MYHAKIVFNNAHHNKVNNIAHKSGHGITNFQITNYNKFANLIKGHHNVIEPFLQIN